MKQINSHNQQGFTLIELMIATTIFTVVLLLVTFGILQITRTYFKGYNSARTQDVNRSVIDTISRDIQFNGQSLSLPDTAFVASNGTTTGYAICIGTDRYSVVLDHQLVDGTPIAGKHQGKHALVVDNMSGS